MSKTRQKSPRRKYDPKRLNHTLIRNEAARQVAAHRKAEEIAGHMTLTPESLCDLGIAYHMAFELMRQHGGEEHFHTLAAAINIAGRFCEAGIGEEHAGAITGAIAALNRVRERASQTGKWALDGQGLREVEHALFVHDMQMKSVTYNELRAAINEVFRLNEAQKADLKLAA